MVRQNDVWCHRLQLQCKHIQVWLLLCLPTRRFDAFDKGFHMLVTFGLVSIEICAGSGHSPTAVAELFVRLIFSLSVVLACE